MGSATYEWLVNQPGDWMYEQPTWVMTRRPQIILDGHAVATFDGDVTELHPKLVSAAGGQDVGSSAAETWPRSSSPAWSTR